MCQEAFLEVLGTQVNSKELLAANLQVPTGLNQGQQQELENFHNLLGEGLGALPQLKEHFETIFAGGKIKISFTTDPGDARIVGDTIVLPLVAKNGQPRAAKDIVDALIFESCNADPEVQEKNAELDEEFSSKRNMTLEEYGIKKAGIEAKRTVLKAAKFAKKLQDGGIEIAEQGNRNIQAILDLDPHFFDENATPDEAQLLTLMAGTPHQHGVTDPTDPQQLNSGDMYHYEKVVALGNVTMTGIIIAAITNKTSDIQDWVRNSGELAQGDRKKLPMIFTLIVEALDSCRLGNFAGLKFSPAMVAVAKANAPNLTIPPCPVQPVTDPSKAKPRELEVLLNGQLRILQELTNLNLGAGFSPAKKNERVAHAKIDQMRKPVQTAVGLVEQLAKKDDEKNRTLVVNAMKAIADPKKNLGDAIAQIVDPTVKDKCQKLFDQL